MLVKLDCSGLALRLTEFSAVSEITWSHIRLLAMLRVRSKDTTMALVDLYEFLNKLLNSCLWGRGLSRILDDTNTPALDRTVGVVHGELSTAVV
jgi:hypothetical protein